ncbi:MAG: S9 family peptidase [Chloroflexota bacterium]
MAYDFARYLNIRSTTTPHYSPDQERLAFLSDTTGDFQVWSMSLTDRQAWPIQLTFFGSKVWELYGTAAEPHIVAVSDLNGNERQQFYLISNFGLDSNGNTQHDVTRLTTDDEAIHRFGAWSKDGQRIVYTCNQRNGVDFDYYLLHIQTGERQVLGQATGNRDIAAWSPDEKYLLVAEGVGSLETALFLYDIEAQQERPLTTQHPAARYWSITWRSSGVTLLTDRLQDRGSICKFDVETGDLAEIEISPHLTEDQISLSEMANFKLSDTENTLAYIMNVDGYSQLYLGDLAQNTDRYIDGLPDGIIGHLQFSPDGKHVICNVETPTHNPDIWQVDLQSGDCQQVTFSNRAGIDFQTLVKPTSIVFPSFDALEIPAYYYQPQTPPPADGYPCILYVHGGPASQTRPDFDVRFQYFLGQGYAILATNVRGSTGYGRAFTALDEVELRMNSVTDLKYAVLWLQQQAEINADKIVVYGRSYGGYMVLAAMTEFPDLFAAGIDVVGIANWVTFMERTSSWRRPHREQEYGSLAHHRDLLTELSPIHKADHIEAPLMVLAGDNDPRVPLSESEQIVEKVRANGGTVEFIHYADEGHKFSKLANRVDSFTKIGEFLQRYL